MKHLHRSLILAGLCAASPYAAAEWESSANVALSTDYVYRGISQTDEEPALSGGFDISHGSGFYLGTWGSNVNFLDGDEAHLEIDVYGGYAGEWQGLGYDVGVLHYMYPGADSDLDYDFTEVYGALSYDFSSFSVGGGVNVTSEFFGGTGDAQYYYAGVDVPVGPVTLTAHVGQQELDQGDDYTDWKLAVAGDWQGFGVELAYFDTDIDDVDAAEDRVVMTVSRSF